MRKFLIIISSLILALLVSVFIVAVYFPQIWIVTYTKIKVSKDKFPGAYFLLVQRTVNAPEGGLGNAKEYSYYDLTFKTPWGEPAKIEERKGVVLLKFSQDNTIAIFDSQYIPNVTKQFLGDDPNDARRIKDFFGEEILGSNYSFYKHTLNTSPDQLTIFMPKKEALAKSILVVLKTVLVVGTAGEGPIYSFETKSFKGFQFGDPKTRHNVLISLFGGGDKQHDILIKGNQEEIDYILSSMEIKN